MSTTTILGPSKNNLSDGRRWYAYSGVITGDVSVPSSISLINIPNIGLEDTYVTVTPFYDKAVSTTNGNQLGVIIKVNDEEIIKSQPAESTEVERNQKFSFFVERQQSLEVLSINTSANNTQGRGVLVTAWK